jgi:membrane protease YdiL (CAAX protease family)
MSSDTFQGRVTDVLQGRGVTPPSAAVILPTLGIVASEVALFYGFLYVSLFGHLITLAGCVFAPLATTRDLPMFQVFALVPVFRLVNLGMPVFFELTLYWFPFVYAPLFPAMFLLIVRRPDLHLDVDLRSAVLLMPAGLLLAAVLGEIEYRIIEPAALIAEPSVVQFLLLAAIMVLFVGFVEEVLFRGILQSALIEALGYWPGVLLTSFLFAMMHSAYGTVLEIAFAALIGLVFGVIYTRTRSITLVAVIHGVLNVFLFGFIPVYGSNVPAL